MSLSMYQASIPEFTRMLGNLAKIVDKAAAHAEAKKIDPQALLVARLAPNMFTFMRQIQVASDTAKSCAARLSGTEPPSFPDTETNFAELKARIAKTIDFLKGFKTEQIDGSEGRKIVLKLPGREVEFQGQAFLTGFALPNFFFHATTAYDILRHNGVELAKGDYLGTA